MSAATTSSRRESIRTLRRLTRMNTPDPNRSLAAAQAQRLKSGAPLGEQPVEPFRLVGEDCCFGVGIAETASG
jgi:hypothetical protein